MKIAKIIIATFSAVMLAASVHAQGNLTPPGAPAPTMKTLQQVEPRTPISSAPYTISQPGSYYLTTNLTSTGHGITITASGVTLDLMGFTISGDGGSSDYGVFMDGATNSLIENIVVRNGIVRNFSNGIRAEYIQDSRFERLISAFNGNSGVYFNGSGGQCNGNTLANYTISGNGSYGISLYGHSGQCDGNTLSDCTISGNENYGVLLNGQGGGRCDGNTIANCTISDNGSYGVNIDSTNGQCDGNTLADCTISDNGSYGVYLYGYLGSAQ